MTLEQLYRIRCQQPSAINEHLPTLRGYAEQCNVVTELGVESGNSTLAFLTAGIDYVISYDIRFDFRLIELMRGMSFYHADTNGFRFLGPSSNLWEYKNCSSLCASLQATDLLFIDTLHTYLQLKEELHLHQDKVKRWIILHDTESFGEFSEGWQDIPNAAKEQKQGLTAAISEFLSTHNTWRVEQVFTNNNGLTVLSRGSQR